MHVPTYYRAQLGWSINQRPMSKRLEHRLREKFNKVDGSSGTHAHTRSLCKHPFADEDAHVSTPKGTSAPMLFDRNPHTLQPNECNTVLKRRREVFSKSTAVESSDTHTRT